MLSRKLNSRTLVSLLHVAKLPRHINALQGVERTCATVGGNETDNVLSLSRQVPRYAKVTPDTIRTTMDNLLGKFDTELASLTEQLATQSSSHSPQERVNLLLDGVEKLTADVGHAYGVVEHLYSVTSTPELRQVHSEYEPKLVRLQSQLGQSQELYNAWKGLEGDASSGSLDKVQARIVSKNLLQARHAGIGLEGTQRDEYNNVLENLSRMSSEFQNHVMDASAAYMTLVGNPNDIEGLPEPLRQAAAHTAQGLEQNEKVLADILERFPASQTGLEYSTVDELRSVLKNATAEHGPWAISIALFQPAMQNLVSSSLRKSLYVDFVTRASDVQTFGGSEVKESGNNGPVIEAILSLRGKQVKLLGENYRHYADLSLATKMAPSVEKVEQLLDELRASALPKAREELNELENYATRHGLSKDGKVQKWDVPYLSEKLKEEKFGLSDEHLRAYFPFSKVKTGLFELVSQLFGVTIVAFDPNNIVDADRVFGLDKGTDWQWHSDTEFMKVIDDTTGECVAGFFMDSFARPGTKRDGAWMAVALTPSKMFNTLPVAQLVCNQMPVAQGEESYMNWREVLTLFHELGHVLNHLLTTVQYSSVAGIHGVEWDAVELPSQFMENFAYERETLDKMTEHRETKLPISDDVYEKLIASRNHMAGWQLARQLEFATLDLALHKTIASPDGSDKTVSEVVKEVAATYELLPSLPYDRTLNSFSHIFAGGYSAGYYSYLWAEVLSADAYEAFEEARETGGDQAVAEKGRLFRDTVLASGGSVHPMEFYKAFRGREPSSQALLKQRGLL